MRVLFVTPECFPYVKTGGLADVSAALPAALRDLGIDIRLLLPGYPGVLDRLRVMRGARPLPGLPGLPPESPARLLASVGEDELPVYALDAPSFYARDGSPYQDAQGQDWPDNHLRFGALSKAAALIGLDGDGEGWTPDIVHAHDWQTGLTAAYLRFDAGLTRRHPASVFTIHNLAFQGLFPASALPKLGLPADAWDLDGVEFWGQVGFLKAGISYADRITTVSPTYAAEIQGPELGFGLDGLLRHRAARLTGILNGVDTRHWDPARDRLIEYPYDAGALEAKAANKAGVRAAFGLDDTAPGPLFAMVSRLTEQKGVDLLLASLPRLIGQGGQLAVLGTGGRATEAALREAVRDHPGRIGLVLAYDEALAHRVQAGADVVLVPSRFEPCGLTQMYGLRYGTLPLVSRVGGLADTVADVTERDVLDGRATGFVFHPVTAEALGQALDRAFALWRRPDLWRRVQRNAMARDVGWAGSARRYAALYQELVDEKARRG